MSGLLDRRWTSACAISLLCLSLSATLPTRAAEAPRAGFAGTIKDSVGHVLDGVEVLIVRRSSTAGPDALLAPVANASSDAWGRFNIPDLEPGVYSVAALKQGYRTYIGNVDTHIKRVLDVILVPMPATSSLTPGTVPEDGAWFLRLPRRTVFRETEAGAGALEEPVARVTPDAPIQMRVDQLFTVGAPFPSQDGDPVKLQGNETRVHLATPIGERGRLSVDGRHESFGSSVESDSEASATSDAAGLSVDFAYDTSLDSRFAVTAFYQERALQWDADTDLPLGSRRQSWGYKSEWQKQLTDQSNLHVAVDYNDDSWRLPHSGDALTSGSLTSPVGADSFLAKRTVVAGGAYEGVAADRHQVQVGFKARLFDFPSIDTAGDAATLFHAGKGGQGRGNDGWSLQLNAQDSWAMTGPFTLLYGVDYQRALTDRDTAVVVPSMGGSWAIDGVAVRFLVSYHAVAQRDSPAATSKYDPRLASAVSGGGRALRDDLLHARDVGYEAVVELPITGALRLKGSSSFVPLQLEGVGGPLHVTDVADLGGSESFLTDGTAAVGETSLSLVHDLGDARTWFEISRGQAEGMLGLGPGHFAALPMLAMGERTYDNGSWGFQMIPSGTDLRVHYKRVVETQASDRDGRPNSERETVELRLIQNLMRFHGLGNWRLLMAVRMAMQDPEDDHGWAEGTDPAVLRSFNEGVSAGLSVTF